MALGIFPPCFLVLPFLDWLKYQGSKNDPCSKQHCSNTKYKHLIMLNRNTNYKYKNRFNSEVAATLLMPHHSLAEVEKLLGLENIKTKRKSDAQAPIEEPLKEDNGSKKPRKLKQFTLQEQVEILDELAASGGNKYR